MCDLSAGRDDAHAGMDEPGIGVGVAARLQQILNRTSRVDRGEMFEVIVREIAVATGLHHVILGLLETDEASVNYVRTIAVWSNDGMAPNFRYPLAGTPCELVASTDICVFEGNVQASYPADELIAQMGVRCYVGMPVNDVDGKAVGVLAAMDDFVIDEKQQVFVVTLLSVFVVRIAAELQHRAREADLERQVADRTSELQLMVARLQSFNQMVSHDLRDPLGGIGGCIQMAEQGIKEGQLDAAAKMLGLASAEAHRLTRLVEDLLGLSLASDRPLCMGPVALDALVAQAKDVLRLSYGDAAVGAVKCGPMPVANIDASLVRQALVNLIGNAIKFTSKVEQPSIHVQAVQVGSSVVVEVSDNGPGFSSEAAGQLFMPFRRLHGSAFSGSGIGLTIVRRVAECHGGRAWAEGAVGVGAKFSLQLCHRPPYRSQSVIGI